MINETLPSVRIDKWLWSVRICKSRTIATDLCKRSKVRIDGLIAKPSREIKPGQTISLNKDGINWLYKVVKCIDKRVGAQEADQCREDLTPLEELKKLEALRADWLPRRAKGSGRPTKKERRDIDSLWGQ